MRASRCVGIRLGVAYPTSGVSCTASLCQSMMLLCLHLTCAKTQRVTLAMRDTPQTSGASFCVKALNPPPFMEGPVCFSRAARSTARLTKRGSLDRLRRPPQWGSDRLLTSCPFNSTRSKRAQLFTFFIKRQGSEMDAPRDGTTNIQFPRETSEWSLVKRSDTSVSWTSAAELFAFQVTW